jgi:deoxyhypusine synthase
VAQWRQRKESRVTRRTPTIDRSRIRTQPARRRASKVKTADEARPLAPGSSVSELLASLPGLLGARDLNDAIDAWVRAWQRERLILFGFGAHLIKVGLAPIIVDLLERGAISGLMMNGAGCVHDLELAMMGRTSEDVAESLDAGRFGMARETAERLNGAIVQGGAEGLGMGAAIGRDIFESGDRFVSRSVLATAWRLEIPVTVHAAIGTDIHHMHPSADGAAIGETSFRDFEKLTSLVAGLSEGVVLNVGSAVILPEVFLKALALARNLGHPVKRLTTVNCDFVRQYRPQTNIVERPTRLGGRGISLIGQHEVLIPLLAAGVIERHDAAPQKPSQRRRQAVSKKGPGKPGPGKPVPRKKGPGKKAVSRRGPGSKKS